MAYESMFLASAFFPLFVLVGIWSVVWKAIALWKSARNSQLAWFIVLSVANTAGILEILYILFFQKKGQVVVRKSKK